MRVVKHNFLFKENVFMLFLGYVWVWVSVTSSTQGIDRGIIGPCKARALCRTRIKGENIPPPHTSFKWGVGGSMVLVNCTPFLG